MSWQHLGDVVAKIVAAAAVGAVTAGGAPARAHDDGTMHYDLECCHQMDCAPVTQSYQMPADEGLQPLVVTTVHGTAVVPPNLKRRMSTDARMHACIRDGKVICIYMPGGS